MALPKIAAPKYNLVVPSTGEEINYRPYLVKEEKVLMLAMESKDQNQQINALKDVITGCTEGKIKADKLSIFDLEYIFLKLRSKSVGEHSDIMVKCNHCEAKNSISINLEEVEVSGDLQKESNIKLTDTVGVILKYPTVKGFQRTLGKDKNKDNIEQVMSTITSMIDSIYDEEEVYMAENESEKALVEFLESLTSDQFKKITDFMTNMPKLSHDISFDCESCKENNQVVIEGLQNFF